MIKNKMLDINPIHIAFISLLMWTLMLIVKRIFINPVGTVINQRETKIQHETSELAKLSQEIKETYDRIEHSLQSARRESLQIKESILKNAEAERLLLVSQAKETARQMIDKKSEQIEADIKDAALKLNTQIGRFSHELKKIIIHD
jgi:F0F1-type ATP synthase membrane subunit b/b'